MKMVTLLRLLLLALVLSVPAPAQETLPPPAADIDTDGPQLSTLGRISELTRPRQPAAAQEGAPPKQTTYVGKQLIKHTNPRTLGRAFRNGYRGRQFLSTHGTVHRNPGDAMLHSIAPETPKAATKGAVKGALDPVNLVVSFGLPVAQEAVRQYIQYGRIDARTLTNANRLAALGGGFAGGVAGTVAGAALQSTLAGSLGPFGAVAGFVARPLLGFAGGMIGARFGENASKGNPSLTEAFRQSWKQFDPGRDLGSLAGGTIGAVVGQALIPIPGVGGFVGSMVGTAVGGWIGSRFFGGKEPNPAGQVGGAVKGLLGKTQATAGYAPVDGLQAPRN